MSNSDLTDVFGPDGFNPDEHEEPQSFDPLPPGWYPVDIEAAELKTTKAATGKYIKVEMAVIGDKFAGRKVFANLNIQNPNAKAEEIGQRELASLSRACGLPVVRDTDDLLGKSLQVRLKIEKGTGEFDDQNTVVGFKPLGDSGTVRTAAKKEGTTYPTAEETETAGKKAASVKPEKEGGKLPWER